MPNPLELSKRVKRRDERRDIRVIRGSCLCGSVEFAIERVVGPFELCHCPRCRKASGSAFVAAVGVQAAGFRLLAGADLIRTYEAPIRERPPAYRVAFCVRCGSPVPDPPKDAVIIIDGFDERVGLAALTYGNEVGIGHLVRDTYRRGDLLAHTSLYLDGDGQIWAGHKGSHSVALTSGQPLILYRFDAGQSKLIPDSLEAYRKRHPKHFLFPNDTVH